MKVLHVIEGVDRNLGGLPFALFNILATETLIGVESEVVSVVPPADAFDAHRFSQPFHLFDASFPARFTRSRRAVGWLEQHLDRFDFLAIHGVWNLLSLEAARVAIRHRKPYVLWPHGSLDPFDLQKKRRLKQRLGPWLIRPVLERAAFVCCTSQREADLLERYGAVARTRTLPLAVAGDLQVGSASRFRREHHFEKRDFVLLFLSRIDYKKGLDITLEALAQLLRSDADRWQKVRLAIAGPDTNGYVHFVRSLVDRLGLSARVTFCGVLSGTRKADAFAGSDCFVLASRNENFGIAVVESLQAGLPVLISKNVYIWADIVAHRGGWACEHSVESLMKHLSEVVNNPLDLADKKAHARTAGRLFSPPVLAAAYRELYDSVGK